MAHRLDRPKLDRFLTGAYRLEEQRNQLVHSFYREGPVNTGKALSIKTTAKARAGLKFQFEEITAELIAEKVREAEHLQSQLSLLMVKNLDYNRYVAAFYGMFKRQA